MMVDFIGIQKQTGQFRLLYDLALNNVFVNFIREFLLYVWTFEKIVKIWKSMVGPTPIHMIQSLQFFWITCFLLGFHK